MTNGVGYYANADFVLKNYKEGKRVGTGFGIKEITYRN